MLSSTTFWRVHNTVLVLGATGGIGGEIARQLRDAGCRPGLRGHRARGQPARVPPLGRAGAAHAGQHHRRRLRPGCHHRAARHGLQLRPGRVPRLAETSPQHPQTRKDAIRVAMEQRLQAATGQGARVLVVRVGDFFGPQAVQNWFSQCLVKPGQPVRTVRYPGRLEAFARFHVAGHWDADGTQMAQAIGRVVARHAGSTPSIAAFPWGLVALASPFVATLREMREMRYLWQMPVQMDNTRLTALLGAEPHTPLDAAVEATLVGLGCLPATSGLATPVVAI